MTNLSAKLRALSEGATAERALEIAKGIADRCSAERSKNTDRYSTILQAARMGAIEALDERESHAAETARLLALVEALEAAISGIADDYMTSEAHHPNHVPIPAAKFEQLCAVSGALASKGKP